MKKVHKVDRVEGLRVRIMPPNPNEPSLSKEEIKRRFTQLFKLLLEMEIQQTNS